MKEKNYVSTCVSFDYETLRKADVIVDQNLLPGIKNRSALIAYALEKVFKELELETRQKCQ